MHNWVEINLDNLRHNFEFIRKMVHPSAVMPVVKSDAYGHGMVETAKALRDAGAEMFAVSKLAEAVRLQEVGIKVPIILLSGVIDGEYEEALNRGIRPVVFTSEHLKKCQETAERYRKNFPIHIKLDTGMGRLGFRIDRINTVLSMVSTCKNVVIEGIMTHFADADSDDLSYTRFQCDLFRRAVQRFQEMNIRPRWVHASNSAATFLFPEARFNLVRPGLALYGPTFFAPQLLPVMSLKARVIQVKDVPPGSPIGYGRTFTTPERMKIATVSVGYSDGYPRALSNKGVVLIRGQRCPLVGRVSMNLITVNVSHLKEVREGDEVVLMGCQSGASIFGDDVADLAGTISYEIYCRIGTNPVKRFLSESSQS